MAKKSKKKSSATLINRLLAVLLALLGRAGLWLMTVEQDTWGLGWLMRAVGTLVMMVFWWPFHLLEIIVRYLTGFEVGSSWITSSLVVILLVSAIGWYVVLVLFSGKGIDKKVTMTVRQIG